MPAAISDKISRGTDSTTGRPVIAKLAGSKAIGAPSITITVATNWTTTTPVYIAIYLLTAAGVKDPTTQVDAKGVLSGTTISNLTYTGGTDRAFTTDAYVEITYTAAQMKDTYDHLTTQHNQDGTHGAITTTSISNAGTLTQTGVATFTAAPVLPNNAITAPALATNAITLGYTSLSANVGPTSTSTSDTDVTGLTVTVTVPAGGRRIKITAAGSDYEQSGGVGTVYGVIKIKEGATVLGTTSISPVTANFPNGWSVISSFVPTAGSHTYKVAIAQNSTGPTYLIGASATGPTFILVELI